jgi:hypothetical protein
MTAHRKYYGSHHCRRAPFSADPKSLDRTHGRQIDWANVANSYIDPS